MKRKASPVISAAILTAALMFAGTVSVMAENTASASSAETGTAAESSSSEAGTAAESSASETGASAPAAENEYIRIGQYDGIPVARVEGLPEITDTAVDNNIQTILKGFSERHETDEAAEEGDAVTIDYTVTVNGEEFPDGGASDYQIIVGDVSMFKGFSDTAAGHKTGDTWDVSHVYDEDYAVAALAGQEAVFHITLAKVEEIAVPALTDDFVQKVSVKSKTVEEYREEVRAVLEGNNQEYVLSEIRDKVWQAVLDTAEVKKYPEGMLEEEIEAFYDYYRAGADFYDMDFDTFLEEMKVTPEQFEEEAVSAAESNVRENLAAALIAEKEGLDLSEEILTPVKEKLAGDYHFNTVEDLISEAPNEEYVNRMAVRELVLDWCADHAEQVNKDELPAGNTDSQE